MLTKKTYNNRINVYSQNKIEPELIKIIINFLFYSKEDSEHNFELIKADKVGTEVWKLNYKNQFYFLKKYFPVKFVKKIKNIFRPTEAVRHFITTILLNRSGIDSFEPVAALTYRKSLWSFDSIFVMKESKGLLLKDFIKSDLGNLKNDEIIAKKFALLWKNLLKNNFWHQDPSPVNFIVNTKTSKPEVNLIDVDNIYKVPYN
ncbi:AarF/UbiB family protein [Halanaerobium salsuginis]|jgi:hypothetical protein|uniref:ABC1 atypical kinase-like domain-containing protein n=1 Tax=Halanaerobium salsuginis TaxID=29563 RepID=A0A1I4GY17_9FIRM|nr:AarF/UbiB family protein [Halanaerobium salsuginis]SFL34026.1 hypothetical protein SAMN02983006_00896 [Halanaerobium salsuginis]